MIELKDKCNQCTHHATCKYTELYNKYYARISEYINDIEDQSDAICNVEVTCKFYGSLEVEAPLDDKTCENCKYAEIEFLSGPCPMCDASHNKFERGDRNVRHQTRTE